jgi:hypothetical protein
MAAERAGEATVLPLVDHQRVLHRAHVVGNQAMRRKKGRRWGWEGEGRRRGLCRGGGIGGTWCFRERRVKGRWRGRWFFMRGRE